MIAGTVAADGTPRIAVPLTGQDWTAVIDTGFNGDLELPATLQDQLELRHVGEIHSSLAGGVSITEDAYELDFSFDGETVTVVTTFTRDSVILLGTHLLRKHRLEIDFPAATVRLERPTDD